MCTGSSMNVPENTSVAKNPSLLYGWLVFNDSTRDKDDTTVGVGHSRRYCNTGYDQSQGRRPSTLKCIGSISKRIYRAPTIRNRTASRSRSDGRSRRYVLYRADQSQRVFYSLSSSLKFHEFNWRMVSWREVVQLNWVYLCGARPDDATESVTIHTALSCNHQSFACPNCSLDNPVRLLWYPAALAYLEFGAWQWRVTSKNIEYSPYVTIPSQSYLQHEWKPLHHWRFIISTHRSHTGVCRINYKKSIKYTILMNNFDIYQQPTHIDK